MTSAYSINLNFNNTIPVKTDFTFKQGDKGITLNLATTGLDPTGTTAHIVFKRSNGTSVEAELTGQTGPSYSYTILGNEFEIPGVVVADLKLYNGDTQRVSTASFIFLVTGDTMDGVGGGTGGYSDQLEQLSEEFEDTLNEYKDAFGDVGAVNPRGAYDSTADYNVLDLVSYQGSSYLCRTACKNKVPTNTTYWQVFASGGGGGTSDYDDLTDKPSINSVTLSGNKTTSDLGLFSGDYDDLENKPTIPSDFDDLADVDMTGVTDGQVPTWDETEGKYKPGTPAGGGGGTNPNIFINGWFTVNQRGSASYTTAGYTVDRWRTDSAVTITVSASDGVLIGGSYLKQILEASVSDALLGEKVTLSIKYADGTISTGTATIPSSYGAAYTSVCSTADNIGFLQVDQSADKFRVIIASSAKYVRAVKLEIGSVSTIAQDTQPDYTTELLRCQRYFVRKSANAAYRVFGLVSTDSSTAAGWALPLAVPLRTNPSISYGGSFYIRANGQNYTVTAMATGANQVSAQVQITLTSSGLTVGVLAMFANDSASAYIDINAEL